VDLLRFAPRYQRRRQEIDERSRNGGDEVKVKKYADEVDFA
jgi:hypothetical protein